MNSRNSILDRVAQFEKSKAIPGLAAAKTARERVEAKPEVICNVSRNS